MTSDELFDTMLKIEESGQPLLSYDKIYAASKSKYTLVRSETAIVLSYYPDNFAIPILLTLLQDKNSDVRSSAAIGLSYSSSKDVYNALKCTFLNDESSVVRAYAGGSFINNKYFEESYISFLENILSLEKNYLVRVVCFGELYKRFANDQHLDSIIYCLNSRKYQTRCAVLNTLAEIVDDSNAYYILSAMENILKKENVDIVRENAFLLQNKARCLLSNR